MTGRIIKGIGGFYYVQTKDGVIECRARGIFRKQHITPTIGDYVTIEVKDGKGAVTGIEERTSLMIRPAVANVDTLMLVMAAAAPAPNLFLADKMLINAAINNAEPVVCINKTDLADSAQLRDIYAGAGYKVITVCAERNEGIEELREFLKGRTTAFAGLSGVGKSTLLSKITGGALETGMVSDKIQRGKHTTRHVELFALEDGGYVLDTPGFSSLEITDIADIKAEELKNWFPETSGENGCRFRGCSHINEPGCCVRERLANGEIAPSRYESYTVLYEILKNIKRY